MDDEIIKSTHQKFTSGRNVPVKKYRNKAGVKPGVAAQGGQGDSRPPNYSFGGLVLPKSALPSYVLNFRWGLIFVGMHPHEN